MTKILNLKILFVAIFVLLTGYYLLVKAELYESKTALIVRDLSSSPGSAGIGLALLGMGPSSQLQDSMVVEEYLLSLDVFMLLERKFNLIKHFKSDDLDILERLSSDATMEETLVFYRERLLIDYDETSNILHVAYAHTDPQIAKEILEFLIAHVEEQLNEFNHRKARKQLKFIEMQYAKVKKKMETSSAVLEQYQNQHLLLDPNNNAQSSSAIITSLEASLNEKKIELSILRDHLNENHYDIVKVKSEIRSREQSIGKQKKTLTGNNKERLNKTLFEYERLKMAVEFDTEVYKNTLIQMEMTKIEVVKEAKTLSIVSRPNLPDGYTYPNKQNVFITILIILLMGYGIVSMLIAIVGDHKE